MPFLLAPAWLLALGAIAVPIVLHLISRGRSRRVRIPSVRLLTANDSRKARRLRPTQLPLLLVRCLLLAAVALALAAPRWPTNAQTAEPDWVLVAPGLLSQRAALGSAAAVAYSQLDALEADGAQLHWLDTGIPPVTLERTRARGDSLDVWSLLREADTQAPAGIKFHAFVPDRLADLQGVRPTLSRDVEWIPVSDPRHNRWIERGPGQSDGAQDGSGAASVLIGRSTGLQTTFHAATPVQENASGNLPIDVVLADQAVRLAEADAVATDNALTLVDRRPLRVAVLHSEERSDDARLLLAALRAAASYAEISVDEVDPTAASTAADVHLDVLAWLSEAALPAHQLARVIPGGIAIADGGSRHEDCPGTLTTLTNACDLSAIGTAKVMVHRCSPSPDPGDGVDLWTDGNGRTLLDVQRGDRSTTLLRFHGRFHPAWSDLTSGAAFPAWALQVLQAAAPQPNTDTSRTPASDLRGASSMGAPQLAAPAATLTSSSELPQFALWALVAALLILERSLATRTERKEPT